MATQDMERGGRKNGGNTSSSYYVETSEKRWIPWLIPMIVVANIAVFVIVMYINDCPKKNLGFQGNCVAKFLGRFSFQPLKGNPLLGPSSSTLVKIGGLEWSKVVHEKQGWRLLSCIWLHAGLIHLLVNMICLMLIGIRLEQQFGFVRIGLIYLLAGFGGSVLAALFSEGAVSVGASGALFGLLGAMLSELLTNWTIYTNKAGVLITLIVVIAINLAVGLVPRVDNFAHIGGFLTGFLLGFILLVRPHFGWTEHPRLAAGARAVSKYKPYQYVFWLVALLLLVAGFTVGLVMLFRGENGNEHCSWCHYLSCVPTSSWNCNS